MIWIGTADILGSSTPNPLVVRLTFGHSDA
jgi:hypothetical protein